jgi:hypothetical protein
MNETARKYGGETGYFTGNAAAFAATQGTDRRYEKSPLRGFSG